MRDDGSIRRLTLEHGDPAKAEVAHHIARGYEVDPNAETGVPSVLRTGTSLFHPQATPAMLAADANDPEGLARLTEQIAIGSWICAPMTARGRTLGAISFLTAESGRRYRRDDLETAELLIRAGANVNAANLSCATPLSLACTNANAAMVEALLKEEPGAMSLQEYLGQRGRGGVG